MYSQESKNDGLGIGTGAINNTYSYTLTPKAAAAWQSAAFDCYILACRSCHKLFKLLCGPFKLLDIFSKLINYFYESV